jgi:hypothetical protein
MEPALSDKALDMRLVQQENWSSTQGWFDTLKHLPTHHTMGKFLFLLIHYNEIIEFLNLRTLIVMELEKHLNQTKYI